MSDLLRRIGRLEPRGGSSVYIVRSEVEEQALREECARRGEVPIIIRRMTPSLR